VTNHRRRWRPLRAVICGLAAITLATGTMAATATSASSSPQGPAASDDKIRPKLLDQLQDTDEVSFWVRFEARADLTKASAIENWDKRGTAVARALKQTAKASQAGVKKQLNQAGVEYQAFWATNAIKVSKGDMELAQQLAGRTEVESLWPSFKVSVPKPIQGKDVREVNAVEWGIANINADDVWSQYGVKGEGIVVANIDTGVQYDHPALVNQYRGNNGDGTFDHNYNWFDAAGNCADAPCDLEQHGTHTMGTMVGDDGAGNQIGVAPGATWIAANGCCPSDAALIASGQWTLEPTDLNGENPDASMRPNIVNNSWGTLAPSNEPFMEDISADWEASGIFGMWSNGNNAPGCQTSGSPGSRIINYSAGAYDINNTIAGFSSRGAGQDGETKPNISAPGVNVRSSIPGSGYTTFNGTSMASPHVAGTIALLWSAAPALFGDVAATKALLDGTAVDHPDDECGGTDDDNNVYGEGQLDALALLNAAPIGDTGTLAGTVTDAATGDPIAGADLTITGGVNREITTGEDGSYSVLLPVGDYQVTAGAFGYGDQTVSATITTDQTTTQDFALEASPQVRVGGTVTDGGGHGWPLYARITIDGVSGAWYTNPTNGRYSIQLPSNATYQLTFTPQYPGYVAATEDVEVGSGNVTHNVAVDVDADSCVAPGYTFASDGEFETFASDGTPDGWTVEDNVGNGQVWAFDDPGGRGNLTGGDGGFAIVDSDAYGPSGSQDTSLVSPVVDLTDVASPVIRFQQDHDWLADTADVDLSVDGGATWENVLRQQQDVRNTLTEIPIPQAAGQNDVQVRFHYYNATYEWWWQVDDVLIGSTVSCDPVDAGLVVGNVSDANTDAGVTGATVTNEGTGASVMTEATPDDPALGDGFYWTVSTATGTQPFTASAEDYVSDSADVEVEADWVTEANFVLDAGLVTTSKTSLEATMKMDRTATRTFNVTNEGTAPAEVTLGTGGGGFVMLGGNAGDASTLHYTDDVAEAAEQAAAAKPPADQSAVGSDNGAGWTAANGAAPKPGRSVMPTLPKTPNDEVTITHSVSQEITALNSVSCNSPAGNAENGFLRTFNLEDFDITTDFNVTSVSFGVESATATQPITVKLYTVEGDLVYANMTEIGSTETTLEAQELTMVTVPVEGTAPAGSTLVVELDSPNLQDIGAFFFPGSNNLGQTAPTYLRSETCGVTEPTDTAEIGFPDMHLVMNVTGETGSSVPWMSVSPETVSLDPGESAQVTVGLDSNVDQPGAYTGRVNVGTDTPYDVEPVGVTMNVTPPATWGKLTGIVTGTDCDGASGPLEEATVQLDWWSGDTTLFTDEEGRYAYWLDSRGNPYSMIVAKDGFKPKAGTAKIVRGQTLTKNFTLQEAGC
jgi:subtilisin family serine protease